jgi:lipoprotein-releasing system permease protein
MNISPLLFVAARSLLGRKKAALVGKDSKDKAGQRLSPSHGLVGAILGIGISLVPLLLVLVVSDGMIEGITRRYIETKTYHIQVAVPDGFSASKAASGLVAARAIPGVITASLETNGSAVAVSASASGSVMLRAADPEFFSERGTKSYLNILEGSLIPRGTRDIVLGSALAKKLKLSVGDQLTIITPNHEAEEGGESDGYAGYRPRLSFFRVTGIVSAGYRDLDEVWAFISPAAGQRLLVYSSCYSFMGLKVEDPYSNSLGEIRLALSESLDSLYPAWFDSYLARTWPEVERSLYASFGTTKITLLFIMGIALLVAAINLGSSLSTFVVEHSMDIAVLRSFGATDKAIRRIFVGAGLLTGSLGTLIGLAAGLLVSLNVNALIRALEWLLNIGGSLFAFLTGRRAVALQLLDPAYYLEVIPVAIDFEQIGSIVLLCIILSALVSLLPAKKAMRVSVQELIRKSA